MDRSACSDWEERVRKTISNLQKNNMEAYYVSTREAAAAKAAELLEDGCTVSMGGTVTAAECGIPELLRSGRYVFLDRTACGNDPETLRQLYGQAFLADVFFTSANAITEEGELYNVDGNGNRVACIAFGPRSVIVVAGINKLVKDLDEAVLRVKSEAAPANAKRLGRKTYCAQNGKCLSIAQGSGSSMTAGCSGQRICSSYLVTGRQMEANKGRIKVILVGEALGY